MGPTGAVWTTCRARTDTMGRDAPGAGAQGDAVVLPRYDAVVTAHSARGARGRLCVQHQVSAAPRRRNHVLSAKRNSVREPDTRGLCTRIDCRAFHLPRDQSRGSNALAVEIESARDASAAVVQVLGWDAAAA